MAGGGDPARHCWWYVTEVTLDHLRPSPKWIKENEELEPAKKCEAMIERGLENLAKHRRKEREKMRLLDGKRPAECLLTGVFPAVS